MSKILNISDTILDIIYHKYDISNIVRFIDKGSIYILIPEELIYREYVGRGWNIIYGCIDAMLSTKDRYFNDRLKYITNLTPQEFYDITILHINDTKDRPVCEYCGKYLEWSGKFSFGYGNSQIAWDPYSNKFCSNKCAAKFNHEQGLIGFGTLYNQISASYHQFLKYKSNYYKAYFYIAISTDNKFKYGITVDPEIRFNYYFGNNIKKYKIIYEDTTLCIANIEAHIKLLLHTHKEYLEFNGLMQDFRKSYKIALSNKDIIPIFSSSSTIESRYNLLVE